MRHSIKYAIAILLMLIPAALRAQSVVKGTVKDPSGPVPGAMILNEASGTWTTTDAKGVFSISGLRKGDVLSFSCLGYSDKSIAWDGESKLDVVLEPASLELEETVVIGYGSVKKKDLTGAVGVVNSSSLETMSYPNISQKLQGAEPGLIVSRSSSAPGSSATITIRGVTNMSNNNPLVLVDGVLVSTLDNVSPDDVDQITVLKDAASASIYGARAAAGVILVTTKSASDGEVAITYNGEYTVVRPTELAEYLTSPEMYMTMYNEWKWNDAGNPSGGDYVQYAKSYIEQYRANNDIDPITYPIFDWRSAILKDHASRQKHTISAAYGNKVVKTRVSALYEDTGGLYEGLSHDRYMIRARSDISISKHLSASVDLSLKHANMHKPQSGSPIRAAEMYPEIYAGTYLSGRVAGGKTGSNTMATLLYGGNIHTSNDYVTTNISLNWKPVNGLSLTASVSPVYNFSMTKSKKNSIAYYDAYDASQKLGMINGYETNRLGENRENSRSMQKQFVVNYEKTFGADHNFNAMAGYEDYYFFHETVSANSSQMEIENFPYLDLANKNQIGVAGSAYETAYQSVFGRLMYNWKGRYYLQANVRADASSRFHPDYRWSVFPSASVGWVVSEEPFFKAVKPVSYLKLRGSLGSLGNERIGNYPYQQSINYEKVVMYNGSGSEAVSKTTGAQVDYAVQDITWETTWTWDAGLDAKFLGDRLSFTGDYYYKETKNMLLDLSIPLFTGFGAPSQNAGSMYTTGWEIKVGWKDRIGDFNYSVSANLTDYTSIMKDLKGVKFTGDQIVAEGIEYNSWYGYKSDGLFQNQEEVKAGAVVTSSTKPGDIRYQDLGGGADGAPDGKITAAGDRTVLGPSLPHYLYGGSVSVGWKGLSLSAMFSGVGKRLSMVSEEMICPIQGQWLSAPANLMAADGTRLYWSVYNTEEQNLNAKYPRLSYTGAKNNNYLTSDFWLIDGSFFRVKDINLSYQFPKKLLKKVGIKGLKFYLDVADPFCFDNYIKGWDPEATTESYIATTWTLGVNLKF